MTGTSRRLPETLMSHFGQTCSPSPQSDQHDAATWRVLHLKKSYNLPFWILGTWWRSTPPWAHNRRGWKYCTSGSYTSSVWRSCPSYVHLSAHQPLNSEPSWPCAWVRTRALDYSRSRCGQYRVWPGWMIPTEDSRWGQIGLISASFLSVIVLPFRMRRKRRWLGPFFI